MKSVFFSLVCTLILTGCNGLNQEIIKESPFSIAIDDSIQYEENVDYFEYDLKDSLEDNQQNEVTALRLLWNTFDQERESHKDPTNDFKNSKYLLELKRFLSKRESLTLSAGELGYLLGQSDYSSVDKKMILGDQEFNIRVIGYNVDFYEQVITDIVDIKNKWIFVQCWNEQAFYFKTLSDGDIHYFYDFMPLEINNRLYILISGYALPYYPHLPFIWAWHLEDGRFQPANIFDSVPYEDEDYRLYNHIAFDTFSYETKWMLYTDGNYLFAQKGGKGADNKMQLMNIQYKTDEENKTISFISKDSQGKETIIRLALVKDQFKVVYD